MNSNRRFRIFDLIHGSAKSLSDPWIRMRIELPEMDELVLDKPNKSFKKGVLELF